MSDAIVFLHAHPDDEAIFTGGTIAGLAAAGVRVIVVLATAGELGEVRGELAADALPDRRAVETSEAAMVLGVDRVVFLGYRDSGLPGDPANDAPGSFFAADTEEAAARVASVLAEEDAAAIVVYDAGGIYGHPDHVQVHRVGVRAVLVTTMVDVRPHLEIKRRAIAAHSSQVPETSSAMTMPDATFADVYGYEWYVRSGPSGIIDRLASRT